MADKNLSKQEQQRLKEKEQFERERKKWKQQESRKRVKKSGGGAKDRGPMLFKIVAVVVAIAVVLGLGSIYASSYGLPGRFMPALTVGGKNIGTPEWAYNFYSVYRQMYQFGSYFGLETDVSAFGQPTTDENDAQTTWDAVFRKQVNMSLQNEFALYSEAKKAGFKLDEEAQKELEQMMAELKEQATGAAMSPSAYLHHSYTAGLTERTYRQLQERQLMVQGFSLKKQEEFREDHPDAELLAKYREDTSAYNQVDYRIYSFAKGAEGVDAKKQAEAFLLGGEEGFLAAAQADYDAQHDHEEEEEEADHAHEYDADAATLNLRKRKADIASAYGDEAFADWFFASTRLTGDSTTWETDSNVFAAYLLRPSYAQTTVNFHTIQVAVGEDKRGEEEQDKPSPEEEAKQKADDLLAKWLENDGATEAFTVLEGKPELHEKAAPGDFSELDSWLFDPARKAGDATVIEVSGGYVVTYLAGLNENDFVWQREIGDTFVSEDFEAYVKGLQELYPLGYHGIGMRYALKDAQKMCDAYMEYMVRQGANNDYSQYLQY